MFANPRIIVNTGLTEGPSPLLLFGEIAYLVCYCMRGWKFSRYNSINRLVFFTKNFLFYQIKYYMGEKWVNKILGNTYVSRYWKYWYGLRYINPSAFSTIMIIFQQMILFEFTFHTHSHFTIFVVTSTEKYAKCFIGKYFTLSFPPHFIMHLQKAELFLSLILHNCKFLISNDLNLSIMISTNTFINCMSFNYADIFLFSLEICRCLQCYSSNIYVDLIN